MAENKNTDVKSKDAKAAPEPETTENEALEPASPEQEMARLDRLKTPELVSEFYFARQRLKTFLETYGIYVPELTFGQEKPPGQLNIASAVYLESFTRAAIRGIGAEVDSVSSSVKSFVVLFDSLISTNAFEEVKVMVDGMEESRTVRQLLEDYDNNRISEDRRVVISVVDLKRQLDSLIDDTSSGSKTFDNVDDEAIAATRENKPEDKVFRPGEGGKHDYSGYSPYISQETFDGLFRQRAEEFTLPGEPEPAPERVSSWGTAASTAAAAAGTAAEDESEIFDDNANIPKEAADIFDDNVDISDEEIERLLGNENETANAESGTDAGFDAKLSSEDINRIFGEDKVPPDGSPPDTPPPTKS